MQFSLEISVLSSCVSGKNLKIYFLHRKKEFRKFVAIMLVW
jgi:hypothetical protein